MQTHASYGIMHTSACLQALRAWAPANTHTTSQRQCKSTISLKAIMVLSTPHLAMVVHARRRGDEAGRLRAVPIPRIRPQGTLQDNARTAGLTKGIMQEIRNHPPMTALLSINAVTG